MREMMGFSLVVLADERRDFSLNDVDRERRQRTHTSPSRVPEYDLEQNLIERSATKRTSDELTIDLEWYRVLMLCGLLRCGLSASHVNRSARCHLRARPRPAATCGA